MKARWDAMSAQFESRPLRERVIIVGAVVLATAAVYNFLYIDPLLVQQKRTSQQIAEISKSAATIESVLQQAKPVADPDATRRVQRDALKNQIAELDKNMQGMEKGLVPPEQVPKLLESMLARNRGLTLMGMRKLPLQRFEPTAGTQPVKPVAGQPAAAPASPEKPDRTIYQHGFELTVQGSYTDLHEYLSRLEKLPWQMFWGKIALSADDYPKLTVTVTVHTLSLNKAWLIV
jgi:MSHA biogenesis protein MshJ